MTRKSTPSPRSSGGTKNTPLPVDHRTMQELYNSLKASHLNLKAAVKSLFSRSRCHGDLTIVKSIVLDYSPLPILNELFDEVIDGHPLHPVPANQHGNTVTPESASKAKKRSIEQPITAVTKALKFSPHMMIKKENHCSSATSPKTTMEFVANDTGGSNDDEDLIVIN